MDSRGSPIYHPNSMHPPTLQRERTPVRRLPLLYFGFAHLSLAAACFVVALDPLDIAGFYYHPRMLAVVHAVALGWITCSILGGLYVIAPTALRTSLPQRRADVVAAVMVLLGVSGLYSHFWIGEMSGMVWSALTVFLAFCFLAARFSMALAAAAIPGEFKLHFGLAFLNLVLTAAIGLLLGLNKVLPVLPGYVLGNVAAHAHLALLGWATMLVMGAGYRLLPLLLPAEPPRGFGVLASALLLQIGAVGLFSGMLQQGRWAMAFSWIAAAGVGTFVFCVVQMFLHRKPAPAHQRGPNVGMWHIAQALVCLVAGAILGLVLASAPSGEWKLRGIMAYGVLILLGFLAQAIVGVAVHREAPLALRVTVFALWSFGVPALAVGLTWDLLGWIRAAALALLVAVVLGGTATASSLRSA